MNLDLDLIKENIKKTGFILEYNVSTILTRNGWTVINNKYYLDDIESLPREIDIIAYRAHQAEGFLCYTTLIISCKKSTERFWSFITKKINENDPNIDLYPTKFWTNNPTLRFMLNKTEWRDEYLKTDLKDKLFIPSNQFCAAQEFDYKKLNPENDKNIFNSISSLMKAQAYELNRLDDRKKESCVYNFNLLSINDLKFCEINLSENKISTKEVEQARFVINYLVDRKDAASRINFYTINSFEKNVQYFNDLHKHNCQFMKDLFNKFYVNVFDGDKAEVYADFFLERIEVSLRICALKLKQSIVCEKISFWFNTKSEELEIGIDNVDDDLLALINTDKDVIKFTRKLLNNIYKYTGRFTYSTYIPF